MKPRFRPSGLSLTPCSNATIPGVVLARGSQLGAFPDALVKAVGEHRFWDRAALVPPRT